MQFSEYEMLLIFLYILCRNSCEPYVCKIIEYIALRRRCWTLCKRDQEWVAPCQIEIIPTIFKNSLL